MLARIGACASVEELERLVAHDKELSDRLMVAKQYCYLVDLTYKGAHRRYGEVLDEKVEERLKYELKTIEWMGFPGYFLIVWDYIRAAREMGVSVGPGRGSAAGSVVAYCLKITNIDPLKYVSSTPSVSRCPMSTSTSMRTAAPTCCATACRNTARSASPRS